MARYALALMLGMGLAVSTLSAQTPAAALDFDGVNDYVNAGNVTATNFGNADFSIEFWVKTSQVSAVNSSIISKRSICDPSNFWNISFQSNGRVYWESMQAGGGNYASFQSTMPINDGVWRHLAFVRNGSNMRLYINGTLNVSGTFSITNLNNADPLQLGRNACSDKPWGTYLDGQMDETRIWNRALTQAEIQDKMNCELEGTENGLIAYYDFNQGIAGGNNATETTLLDRSVNGNNGTLTNFALNGPASNWVAAANLTDTDGDGVPDCNDGCPNDANKTAPGVCGCGVADVETTWYADTDGDGAGDPNNSLPGFTCIQPEGYVANSDDQCPDDANKTEPGACGCGVADTDSDGDGVPDCIDNCIETHNPGQEDSDGDGIGDVCDACPTIPDPNCASCGNNKYLVCHIPAGNPDNPQQLCLPLNAANTHIGNHGGCYFGLCNPGMMGSGDNSGAAAIHGHESKSNSHGANRNNPVIETAQGNAYFFELTPNPASGSVNIHLHGHEAGAHLYIRDQLGRLVHHQPVDAEESHFTLALESNRFANGIYYFTIMNNGETITRRLVVLK